MIHRHSFSQSDINTRVGRVNKYNNIISAISGQFSVAPQMVQAIIAVESSGNPNAGEGRTTGAKGLMQIIKQTWEGITQQYNTVNYAGRPLSDYKNRETNRYWADPSLNVTVGTLCVRQKAKSLSYLLKIDVSPDDPKDALLILTAYNAGEGTVSRAYKRAVAGGSSNPSADFLDMPYLKPTIHEIGSKYGWNIEAKVKEISEYASKVLTFFEIFGGKFDFSSGSSSHNSTTTHTTTNTNPYVNTSNNTSSSGRYTVVGGDTGYGIAKKLGVSFSALSAANPSVNWGRMYAGQKLNIPSGGNNPSSGGTTTYNPPAPTPQGPQQNSAGQYYLVRSGDSGYVIANKLGVSFSALARKNPAINWSNLRIGQRIEVPAGGRIPSSGGGSSHSSTTTTYPPKKPTTHISTNTSTSTRTYTVVSGDSGYGIAKKLGISFAKLSQLNPSVNWGRLYLGQKLKAPGSSSTTSHATHTSTTPPRVNTTSNTTKPPTTNTSSSSTGGTYKVVSGDSGYVIAKKLGISFSALAAANPSVNWGKLYVGQKLNKPGGSSSSSTTKPPTTHSSSGGGTYTIVSGDSGYGIAKKLGVSFGALAGANPGVNWSRLSVGQKINRP